jgi:organic radical activating enzyme
MRNENSGQYRVCCHHKGDLTEFVGKSEFDSNDSMESWLNSDYMQYLRQQLDQGHRVPECRKCWDQEAVGLTSLREHTNDMISNRLERSLDQTWVPLYFKNKNDYRADLLIAADVKINNLCNFSCAMCNAAESSIIYNKWHKQQDNKFVLEYIQSKPDYFTKIKDAYMVKNGMQMFEEVLAQPIKYLKILGGEPLLNSKLIDRLANIPEQQKRQLNLTFITNGSVDLVDISKQLVGFKSVYYVVSLEATGLIQDYIRRGSDWKIIEQNIDNFLLYAKTVSDNFVVETHSTIQALSIAGYADLKKWCQARNIRSAIFVLEDPDYLSLSVLPDQLRSDAIAEIEQLSLDNEVAALLLILKETVYNADLAEKFIKFIKWYDPNLELLDVDSKWKILFT